MPQSIRHERPGAAGSALGAARQVRPCAEGRRCARRGMTRPAHDERILARIEAELRRSDPWLVALFDRLADNGRRSVAAAWRRLRIALLLTIAVVLAVGQVTGWPTWRAGVVLAHFDGRAVALAQAQLHDWRQEIQALVWGSPPP